jgi:hypothetical protein
MVCTVSAAHDRERNHANLEPSTHIQLSLGAAMSGVEFLAANRLRSWAFEYVRDELFGKLELDAIVSRAEIAG